MGKPSITNIKPPSQTTVWVPSKTTWDLNVAADVTAAGADYAANTGTGTDAYALKVATINTNEPSALDVTQQGMIDGYGYVFFGVNGGEDETVQGKYNEAGILVTGNGKDHVTGGNLGDLIWSGNGADVDHGGAGNDIIFGENGPDQLWGDSDNGSASYTPPQEGQLVLNPGASDFPSDPNGTSVAVGVPSKTTVAKEGVYVAVDGDGHPTELDGDGNPVIHLVYSITPETTGTFTIAYSHGNGLDGAGDPAFNPGDLDFISVTLTAGQKYFFSITYDAGHPTIQVDVFAGTITPHGDNTDPQKVATSQAVPDVSWEDLFTETGGANGQFDFTEGDQLVGGNGPDQFIYDLSDATSVDIIWDYNQGDGTYNVLEGDVVRLVNATQQDLDDAQIFTDYDIDGDGNNDLVILFSTNHAIGLVGINDIADVTFVFGAP
jgi:hypothetical protein